VTKINHDLQNNDWTTTLETQICILDQDTFYDESGLPKLTKNIKREGFPQAANQALVESLLYPIIYAYAEYLTYRSIIGYLWAATDDGSDSNISPGSTILTIDKYFNNSDQDNYKKYWGANIEAFISGGKNLSQFIGDYISKFKTNESARLNTIIYDGYTLNDALTDLQTKPQYTDITTKIQSEVFSKANLQQKLWYNSEKGLDPSTFFSYGPNYPNTNVRPVNLNRTNVNTEINRILVNSNEEFRKLSNNYTNFRSTSGQIGLSLIPIVNPVTDTTNNLFSSPSDIVSNNEIDNNLIVDLAKIKFKDLTSWNYYVDKIDFTNSTKPIFPSLKSLFDKFLINKTK
jgi:hypothetical protein